MRPSQQLAWAHWLASIKPNQNEPHIQLLSIPKPTTNNQPRPTTSSPKTLLQLPPEQKPSTHETISCRAAECGRAKATSWPWEKFSFTIERNPAPWLLFSSMSVKIKVFVVYIYIYSSSSSFPCDMIIQIILLLP